mmetsp:Transcript_34947/g.83109  ORF Transcript_34947/g.83109 Transcript_34947/m.83109 type:complete len:208 (-) Transcript_34947:344-967(-)
MRSRAVISSRASSGRPSAMRQLARVSQASLVSSRAEMAAWQSAMASSYILRRVRTLARSEKREARIAAFAGIVDRARASVRSFSASSNWRQLAHSFALVMHSLMIRNDLRLRAAWGWSGSSRKASRQCLIPWTISPLWKRAMPRTAKASAFLSSLLRMRRVMVMALSVRPASVAAFATHSRVRVSPLDASTAWKISSAVTKSPLLNA